jgi:hypothetical protein
MRIPWQDGRRFRLACEGRWSWQIVALRAPIGRPRILSRAAAFALETGCILAWLRYAVKASWVNGETVLGRGKALCGSGIFQDIFVDIE